jgi:hypothetical protein
MPTEKVLKKVHEDALHGNFFIYIHVSFFENKIYGFQMHAKGGRGIPTSRDVAGHESKTRTMKKAQNKIWVAIFFISFGFPSILIAVYVVERLEHLACLYRHQLCNMNTEKKKKKKGEV